MKRWLAGLSLIILLTGVPVAWSDFFLAASDRAGGNLVTQLVFGAAYACSILYLLGRRRDVITFFRRNYAFTFLLLIVAVSPLWSEVPMISMRRTLAVLGTATCGLCLGMAFSLRDLVRMLATLAILVAVASLLYFVIDPVYVIQSDLPGAPWRGVTIHKNILGYLMAYGTCALGLAWITGALPRLLATAGLALTCLLLALSKSATSQVITFLALLMLAWIVFVGRFAVRPRLVVGIVLVLGGLFLAGQIRSHKLAENLASSGTAVLDRDTTLTGRTELWVLLEGQIANAPWLGYGFGGFWSVDEGPAQQMLESRVNPTWVPTHAHSGYLETALAIGIPGAMVFLACLILLLHRSFLLLRGPAGESERFFPFIVLCMLIVENLTDSAFLVANDLHLPLLAIVAAATAGLTPPSRLRQTPAAFPRSRRAEGPAHGALERPRP